MVNLVGSVPAEGSFGSEPGTHLHLYGKASRPGRKLGHVTVTAPDPDTRDRVLGRVTQTADKR
jgi:5-(carboxyamino)imidazole ribonucleotide synthase